MAHAFPGFATQFAVGMTAAWVFARARAQPIDEYRRCSRRCAAASASGHHGHRRLAGVGGRERHRRVLRSLGQDVRPQHRLRRFVCATALAPLRTQWVAGNDASRLLGTVCYGAYLSHLPLIYLLIPALGLGTGEATRICSCSRPSSFPCRSRSGSSRTPSWKNRSGARRRRGGPSRRYRRERAAALRWQKHGG